MQNLDLNSDFLIITIPKIWTVVLASNGICIRNKCTSLRGRCIWFAKLNLFRKQIIPVLQQRKQRNSGYFRPRIRCRPQILADPGPGPGLRQRRGTRLLAMGLPIHRLGDYFFQSDFSRMAPSEGLSPPKKRLAGLLLRSRS